MNIRSPVLFYLSSGDIYLSLGICLSCLFVSVSEFFAVIFFKTFVILLAILLPINSPVASAVLYCFQEF